ncbi:MAG: hypothetical protein GX640_24065 [Fibrobacter sp.]|nr:hypothetical protein [Fibrobacter sp.]
MNNRKLLILAKRIREYVSYDVCNDTITIGLIRNYVESSRAENISFDDADYYLNWLVKEVDDETAMKYIQKPSPDLPDDTVVAIFYKNVWNILNIRINIDEIVRDVFGKQKVNKYNPLCIRKRFFYREDYQLVEISDDYFSQIKKRAPDPAMVELIHSSNEKLPDNAILTKIYGDIWKDGPLFREYPDN